MKKIVYGIAAVVICCIIGGILLVSHKDEPKMEIVTVSTLKKMIQISELSTYEVIYNGIATAKNEKKTEKVDYYVAYEARVKAGIDFEDVQIEVNSAEKRVLVELPDIEVHEINVDIGKLDFIFMNNKADTETVLAEAYEICKADVEEESNSENAIYELATENAKNIVEALIRPFVEAAGAEYILEIR